MVHRHPIRELGCALARAAVVLTCLLRAGVAQAATPGTLDHYVALALESSPRLEAAAASVRASERRAATVGVFADPEVRYERTLSGIEAMGGERQRLALEQRIAWPTGPWAEQRASAHEAEAMRAQASRAEREVRLAVSRAFWDLWLAREARAARQRDEALLASMVSSIRARLEVGRSSLAELATVELALARAHDDLATLANDERLAKVALAALIGVAPDAHLETVATCAAPMPPSDTARTGAADTAEEVVRTHPEVRELVSASRVELAMAEAAAARRWPMLGVGLELVDMATPISPPSGSGMPPNRLVDAWALMGLVSLPLWQDRYTAEEQLRRAEAEAASARATDRARELASSYRAAKLTEREATRRLGALERDLMPKARLALEATLGGLATGQNDLRDVLMVERELVELETTRANVCATRAVAVATQTMLDGLAPTPGGVAQLQGEVQP